MGGLQSYMKFPDEPVVIVLILSMCLIASYTDIREKKIKSKMLLCFAIMRVLVAPIYPLSLGTLWGGLAGAAVLFIVALIINTNHMAGDIKLLFVLGLWVGAGPVLFIQVMGIVTFLVVAVVCRAVSKGRVKRLPWAPFFTVWCVFLAAVPYLTG